MTTHIIGASLSEPHINRMVVHELCMVVYVCRSAPYNCTAVCVNLAIFVWSTNEVCACSKFKCLCCVDEILLCTHALFTVGDSNFARLTQTAVQRLHIMLYSAKSAC